MHAVKQACLVYRLIRPFPLMELNLRADAWHNQVPMPRLLHMALLEWLDKAWPDKESMAFMADEDTLAVLGHW